MQCMRLTPLLAQVSDEITKLESAKGTTEAELEAHVDPLNVALECLTLRERRREGDLVKDDAEVLYQVAVTQYHRKYTFNYWQLLMRKCQASRM